MSRIGRAIPAVLYAGVLVALSLSPTGPATGSETARMVKRWLFNLTHVPAYALLTLLVYWALSRTLHAQRGRLMLAAVLAATLGVMLEVLQRWVPGRFPDVVDGSLNALGCVLTILMLWGRKRRGIRAIALAADERSI